MGIGGDSVSEAICARGGTVNLPTWTTNIDTMTSLLLMMS